MAIPSDQKFSGFADGGDLVHDDIVVGLRNGVNTRFSYQGDPNLYLPLAGGTMAGAILMAGFAITDLPTPTNPSDAATKDYVDSTTGAYLPLAGGTMSGSINMGSQLINALLDPVSAQDAATKNYVDTTTGVYLPLAGGTMSGAIAMGGFAITGVLDPVSAQDAATKAYADLMLPLTGGTMSGAIAMGTSKITGMGDPTLAQDAATKFYVDAAIGAAVVPAALSKTDDTNVTMTLGGTPLTALLQATSMTLGWTGQLSAPRGGTGLGTYVVGDVLYASATNALSALAGNVTTAKQYLSQTGSGAASAAPVWSAVDGGDITGAALTKADDTNVTLTLGGTPTTALLRAASITLGWTGELAVPRGGTGLAALTAHYLPIGNGTSALTLLAPSATSGVPLISQGASADPAYGTAVVAGGGTGNTTFTEYSVILAGTTATGAFQNVSGVGTAGQVLQSNGAGLIPSWETIPGATSAALSKSDDTNVTLTLGGTPLTALLSATSITAGWTGELAVPRGGTGLAALTAHYLPIGNGTSAVTLLAPSATSGVPLISQGSSADPAYGTAVVAGGGTGNTTFTSYSLICAGTTATGAFQNVVGVGSAGEVLTSNGASALPTWQASASVTPAALTKADDTNVTLTLGGTPATSLLQATSLTLGWTGQLGLTRGGSNASLTASNGGIVWSNATQFQILAGTATAGQMLQSGATGAPSWSTATYPATAGTNGNVLTSDGTNWVSSPPVAGGSPLTTKGDLYTFTTIDARLAVGTTNGQMLQVSSGAATGLAWSTPTYPSASGTAGKLLRSDGTNNVYSTATYPDTASTSGNVLTSDGTNWVSSSQSNAAFNMVIGGDFGTNPWQRGTTFTAPAQNTYTADRFTLLNLGTTAVVDVKKTPDAPTASQADVYTDSCIEYVVTTADATIAAGDLYGLWYKFEAFDVAKCGFGQSGTRSVTLSFWHKNTVTGTYSGSLCNSAQNRFYPFEYTQTTTNTWEKATITVAVDTSGTWLYNTNGIGLQLTLMMACGSNFAGTATGSWSGTSAQFGSTNQVNNLATIGNYMRIALIQLEPGTVANSFAYENREQVLAKCQRYYRKSFPQGTTPAQSAGVTGCITAVNPTSSSGGYCFVQFSVPMRATPSTPTTYNPSAANADWRDIIGASDRTVTVNSGGTLSQYGVLFTSPNSPTSLGRVLAIHYTAEAEL